MNQNFVMLDINGESQGFKGVTVAFGNSKS